MSILAIDVDNTVCNLQETTIRLFNERFNAHYTMDDMAEYDIMNILPTQDAIVMKGIHRESGLYNKVKPYSYASECLQKLINSGHEVYLLTDAIPETYGEKVKFIKQYFPFIDEGHIVSIKHKWMFKCDVMIEDNLTNLLAKPYYHRICFDQPWNRGVKDYAYDIHRVYSWNEVYGVINKINDME